MTRGDALWEGRRRAEEIQLRIRYTPEPPSQDDDMPFLIWPLIVRIYIYDRRGVLRRGGRSASEALLTTRTRPRYT